MTIAFGSIAALWLLAVLPVVWLASWRSGWRHRRSRRLLHVALRSVILACLVFALARPVLSLPATRVALVHLVDASHSVSARAMAAAADAIDQMTSALRPDDTRILVFGGRASTVADTAALRALASAPAAPDFDARVAPEGTNIEQALSAARAEIPPGANGRILLWSDGRETEGDSRRMAERLAAVRVPVFATAVPTRAVGDTWIEDLRSTLAPVAHGPATIDVVVGSDIARPVEITLSENGRVLARTAAAAMVGSKAVPVRVTFDATGSHLIEAGIELTGDVLDGNNRMLKEIVVDPRPRVLYVHSEEGTSVAPVALAEAGLDLTRARPQVLPARADAYDRWDVVVLSNVARSMISTEAMAAIGEWVEERGGGLLFAGGSAVVGEEGARGQGGYRRTEIERILPVTFEREDEPEVALVIVLDRSWSMYGDAMELSKTAAEAAANTLAPAQLVGVLTFNNDSNWDVPLSRVRDAKAGLHQAISQITASGPTSIYPALERAYEVLAAARARAKHVVLLSDGQTAPADFEGLVKKMSDANITVSSVALGSEADATLLGNVATWGGGRSYVVHDAKQIPEIFVTEAKNASTPGADDGTALETTLRHSAFFVEGVSKVPALHGRNAVTRKPQSIDLLSTAKNEPLLTMWPAGLGRTAMFAADLDGRWTRDWLKWRGFGGFVATVVRSLAPQRLAARSLDVVAAERQGALRVLDVTFDARDVAGRRQSFLAPVLRVHRSDAQDVTLPLPQVGPGRYQTRVVADVSEPLTLTVPPVGSAGATTRIFAADAFAEYRFMDPDLPLLEALARTTGGAVNPTVEAVQDAPRTAGAARQPLAPWLVGLALLLWPVDIGIRRLR